MAQSLAALAGLTQYSIGEPTDEEQLYLEYVNRARLDPPAEALRLQSTSDPDLLANYNFHGVDLELMAQQVSALSPAQPLAFNAQLIAAARSHSADMLEHAFQAHEGTDGSTFATRATAHGYDWSTIAENVFSAAHSIEHGHAGFEVDWGGSGDPAEGGMQTPAGHRLNIHGPEFVEVGIGVVNGTNADVGPQLVTQDFGARAGLTRFVTGVVFYDLNTNEFYDLGEGVGGVTVLANGSSFYAVTGNSGGYTLPVPGDGAYGVTFQIPGVPERAAAATVTGGNVKVDLALPYVPPVVSGSASPAVNQPNEFTFTVVGGATGYQWTQFKRIAAPEPEGAEDGLDGVIATVSSSYSVLDNAVRASGQSAFHLAHPRSGGTNSPPVDQFLALDRLFYAGPAAQLTFATRLGWATPDQVARAQISTDAGAAWQDIWSQPGTGDAGETAFTTRSISLASFANREFSVRFVYEFTGGGFFAETDAGVGFYVDDIAFEGSDELLGATVTEASPDASFTFTPPELGPFALRVRPKIGERLLPWGAFKFVTAQAGSTLSVTLTSIERLADGRLQFRFSVVNPGSGEYHVQGAPDILGPWSDEDGASIVPSESTESLQAIIPPPAGPQRFYKIVAD